MDRNPAAIQGWYSRGWEVVVVTDNDIDTFRATAIAEIIECSAT